LGGPLLSANSYQTVWVEQDIAAPLVVTSNTPPSARIFRIDAALGGLADALKSMGATVALTPSPDALLNQSAETAHATDLLVHWPEQHALIKNPLKLTEFCGYLITLAQQLVTYSTPPKLWLVSVSQQASDAVVAEAAPFAFAAEGLLRSVFLEFPVLQGGVLSFSLGKLERPSLQQLMLAADRLLSGQNEVATLFIDQDQHAKSFVKRLQSASAEVLAALNEKPSPPKRSPRSDSSYLISGGHGALGLQAAKTLAAQGAGKIVLMSRTPPSEQACQDIEALRQTGCLIQSEAVDITKLDQLATLINQLSQDVMPLRGIIHAAGSMHHDALMDMSQEAFNAVMVPKALGAWYLHTLTQTLDLDCFVLYGSISSLLGTNGLSHYTAANQFLNGLSQHRQHQGLHSVCINWGPWPVGGMVDERSLELATASGFSPLDPSLTHEAMSHLFFSDFPQIAVVQADWNRVNSLFETRCPQPILSALIVKRLDSTVPQSEPSKVSSATDSTGKVSDPHALHTALTDILESERPEFLAHKLQQALAVVLQFPAGQMPERTRGFFDMGMDSISSVDFRLSLEDLISKTLPPSIVFDYPTIDTLTTHLLTKIFAQEHPKIVERSSVSDDRSLIKTTKQTKSSSASTTKIEELSDEELAMLIDQELNALNQMDTPR
jgi:NADP-dependent 3-hydroxy acid dehydrogenase YdfG/acyl carrier protein